MNVYVASSWRNKYQPDVVTFIEEAGHQVYDFRNPPNGTGFGWRQLDPNWESWTTQEYIAALQHPVAKAGFRSDFDAMMWADACVLVLPAGRSASIEAGWCRGAGKRLFVYQPEPCEPELMYLMANAVVGDLTSLVALLGGP